MDIVPTRPLTGGTSAGRRRDRVHSLTKEELRLIGLSRVGYVTGLRNNDDAFDFMIHGADGVTVAVVDDLRLVVDLAESLGLMLVTVH